jgi:hypothetical protein
LDPEELEEDSVCGSVYSWLDSWVDTWFGKEAEEDEEGTIPTTLSCCAEQKCEDERNRQLHECLLMQQEDVQYTPNGYPRKRLKYFLTWMPSYRFGSIPDFVQERYEKKPCAICSKCFEESSIIRRFRCEHAFHQNCIDSHLVNGRECPTCHRDVEEMEIAHRESMNQDVGGATRRQILGYRNMEFGHEPIDYHPRKRKHGDMMQQDTDAAQAG